MGAPVLPLPLDPVKGTEVTVKAPVRLLAVLKRLLLLREDSVLTCTGEGDRSGVWEWRDMFKRWRVCACSRVIGNCREELLR